MAILLVGIVIAVGVKSLEEDSSNKDSFWNYYEAVGEFIKTNPLENYAKESLEDLHKYLVEEDVYGKAFKFANDMKDYTADSVEKLRKHGESLSNELKDVATVYYHEAKTSAEELYEISKESAFKFKDYAQKHTKESLEDLHEYLVEEDVYGKGFKFANDIKDYTADSVEMLHNFGQSLGGGFKDVSTENYYDPILSAEELYNISKESAYKLKDYAQKSASEFKEYSSQLMQDLAEKVLNSDLYKNSQRSVYGFLEYARVLLKNPFNQFREYVEQAFKNIQETDYYKAKKATIDFKEYAKRHPYSRLTASNLEDSFDFISEVYGKAKETLNNNSTTQDMMENVEVVYDFIMNDMVSNVIEYFEYGVDMNKDIVEDNSPRLEYKTYLNIGEDIYVIINMSDEKLNLVLNFYNIHENYVVDLLRCINNFPEAIHIESCKNKHHVNISPYLYESCRADNIAKVYNKEVSAYSYVHGLVQMSIYLNRYLNTSFSFIYDIFQATEYKLASIILSLFENLSYESILSIFVSTYQDILNIYQTHSFKNFVIIYCKKFKSLSTSTLSNFIKIIEKLLMIEIPTTYIERVIDLIYKFKYLKLYRLVKDFAIYIPSKYDISLNKTPLKHISDVIELAIQGGIAHVASRLGIDYMKEKLDIKINSWFLGYMSRIQKRFYNSGVYSGSKEVLKIVSKGLSYGLEVISIDRLSDILSIINGNDEFYGLNKINPFDILIPSIILTLSTFIFGASATLSFSIAQLVSEVISSILFPQSNPSLEVCDYKDYIIHHLLYYDNSHCPPKSPHKSSKSTRCSDYLQRVSYRFYSVYEDVSKYRYYRLPLDLVDSILDSDTYYSECF